MGMKRAIGDNVVLELVENYMTAGGIILPNKMNRPLWEGKCVAVGPGRLLNSGDRNETGCVVGEHYLFDPLQAVPYSDDNRKLMIIDCDGIFAEVEPAPEQSPILVE